MGRRPICLACVLLMLVLCLADLAGIPVLRGNPLPESVQAWISLHPEAVICGEVQQCTETENSQSVYLKNVYLIYESEISVNQKPAEDTRISIENVKVFLDKKKYTDSINIPAGTFLLLSGKLEPVPGTRNPGEFDSRQYYACKHIYYYLKNGEILQKSDDYSIYLQGLLNVRETFAAIFREAAGEDAPVFEAMVLGEKSDLDAETKIRYQMAGMIHILAISGMHISLLGAGLYQIFKKMGLGLFLSGLISLVFVLQYGMLTGGSVAAMRAVCMFLMTVGAELLGRCYDGMTALALSAVLLIFHSPANLCSSGFLLSFGAVLGIAAGQSFGEMLEKAGWEFGGMSEWKSKLARALISSVWVQLVTLPVMLYFYGEVSIAGIFLNLAVLPTVGMVLLSGVCGGLSGLFCIRLAEVFLVPGRVLLFFYNWLCEKAGAFPWCTWIGGQPKIWQAGVYYGILLLVLIVGNLLAQRSRKLIFGCVLPIGLGIFILGWHPFHGLSITCLDVGQGDGIVLETSEGHHFLVDGGSSNQSKVGQYQILPFLKNRGISRLDGILVSHTDQDHISGIEELLEMIEKHLTGIRVEYLFLPEWEEKNERYLRLEKLAEKSGITVVKAGKGDVWKAGKLELIFLAPEQTGENISEHKAEGEVSMDVSGKQTLTGQGADVNGDGMVFEICYGDFRGLFTGDIGEETEKALLPYLEDVDFLKVAHHGSRYSTGEEFLKKVLPEVGVISSSLNNHYGHPSPETIKRLEEAGCRVEYTMKNGAITYWTDGNQYTVGRWINSTDLVVNGHVC